MPGLWDKDKESWRPSERDWALARELASAREKDHDAVASALLALMTRDGSGDASCEDGHEIKAVMGDLWGVYGDTDELAIGEMAVWVGVSAAHRDAAFAACRWIIDEVKARVPIWKHERYRAGDAGWLHPEP